MEYGERVPRTVTILMLLLAASCGGSASESPWPEEPVDVDPGPTGEELKRGNVVDPRKAPNRYTKEKKAPAEEEEPPIEDEEPPEEEED
jgi:hypothetical protein